MLAEPEPGPGQSRPDAPASWLELAAGASPPVRINMGAAAAVPNGPAEPPWPTPAECYLAALSPVTSMSIGTDGRTVELDTAGIVAGVADALLWVGALPPGSPLLSSDTMPATERGWRKQVKQHWDVRNLRRDPRPGLFHDHGQKQPNNDENCPRS